MDKIVRFLKTSKLKYLLIILGLVIAFCLGKLTGDPNKTLKYGDTGFPKNCRAIVHENYKGYQSKEYTPDEVMESINRNCGQFGISWGR